MKKIKQLVTMLGLLALPVFFSGCSNEPEEEGCNCDNNSLEGAWKKVNEVYNNEGDLTETVTNYLYLSSDETYQIVQTTVNAISQRETVNYKESYDWYFLDNVLYISLPVDTYGDILGSDDDETESDDAENSDSDDSATGDSTPANPTKYATYKVKSVSDKYMTIAYVGTYTKPDITDEETGEVTPGQIVPAATDWVTFVKCDYSEIEPYFTESE